MRRLRPLIRALCAALTLTGACASDSLPKGQSTVLDDGDPLDAALDAPVDSGEGDGGDVPAEDEGGGDIRLTDTTQRPDCAGAVEQVGCLITPGCRWASCGRCVEVAVEEQVACPPPTCAQLGDVGACGARADCAWFDCVGVCADVGTPRELICPPVCTDFHDDQRGCLYAPLSCVWYECNRRCRDPDDAVPGCQPSQGGCGAWGDVATCDAHASECAWFACEQRCYPKTTSLTFVCGQGSCVGQTTEADCGTNPRCRWYDCVDRCYEVGSVEGDVCR